MDVVVLKDWVTETKVTLFRSSTSTNLAKFNLLKIHREANQRSCIRW